MVWSAWDSAWADGFAVAKDYAAVHGHFLPPTHAVWGGGGGWAIGTWAKNQRAAARKTRENAERRSAGENRACRTSASSPRAAWTPWTPLIRAGARHGASTGNAASR
ncbi:helicase associated domain-containing protein [Streptomyces sp. NPDC127066]|uniref:helicase associated domain-containing protein n=1 Tax=Streptomyces sp. NPDC127066 TaxID=3347125 RepID=UPI003669487C